MKGIISDSIQRELFRFIPTPFVSRILECPTHTINTTKKPCVSLCFAVHQSINQNNGFFDEGKPTFLIPPENKILGKHLVYFDVDDLFRLIGEGAKEGNWGIRGEKINYYDFDKLKDDSWLTKIHNFVDPLFIHDAKHNNQNEFRFVLTNNLLPKGAIDLTLRCGEWHINPQHIELA